MGDIIYKFFTKGEKMASFNLTTQNGFNTAKDFLLSNKSGILGFVSNAFFVANPATALIKMALEKGYDLLTQKDKIEAQKDMVSTLIKQGKENGVDNMEIIVDNTVGLSFNGSQIDGCPIKATLGSNDKMTIKVQYKA